MCCMIHKKIFALLSALILTTVTTTSARNNPLFYRPRAFNGEPRLAPDQLTTINCYLGGGSATCSYDACGNKVPLLNLYAPNVLADGTPFNLSGHLGFFEAELEGFFNIYCGLFAHAYVPVSLIRLCPGIPTRKDNNSSDLPAIIGREPLKKVGLGDCVFGFGWTYNYVETNFLDYIDTSILIDVVTPSSKSADASKPLDFALGYNGHTGVRLSWYGSIGIYTWLTFGAYASGTFFNTKNQCITTPVGREQGILLHGQTTVDNKLGSLLSTQIYIKADRPIMGFSTLLGYGFDHQGASCEQACAPAHCSAFLNKYLGWSMHTLFWQLEYDFATEEHPCRPHVGIELDTVIGGSRITDSWMITGYVGWDF